MCKEFWVGFNKSAWKLNLKHVQFQFDVAQKLLTITELRKHDGEEKWHSNDLEGLPDSVKENSVLWVDAQDLSEAEVALLKKRFAIDELDLEELNEEGRRSRIEEIEDRVSCVISFPSRDRFVSEIKTERLALLMG